MSGEEGIAERGGESARPSPIANPPSRKVSSRAELYHALDRGGALVPVRLGELLLERRILKREELERALELHSRDPGKHLGGVLTELGMLSREQLYAALCSKLGSPLVDVLRFDVEPAALAALPAELMREAHVLPLSYRDGALIVAVPDLLDTELLARIRFLADRPVTAVLALPEEIDRALGVHLFPHCGPRVEEIAKELRSEPQPETESQHETITETDSALVRLVNRIIMDAHAAGASDIHVETNPGRSDVLVRFRVDGELTDYLSLPFNFRAALVSRLKVMADLDIAERRRAQDGRIDFSHFGPLELELRMVTVPTREGVEDVVMRLLTASEPLPADRLGLADSLLAALRKLAHKPHGLLLAVGPTGSGKTTTLHSLVALVNRPGVKIWTAENPVEITQPRLRQVQVNPRIGWDFATVMRAFLRADPDVIMVGEMRDRETAAIAVDASLTGHLVLSTLHTNSAAETVVRLLDMGLDPFSFTDSLLGVLGQRLVRRLCPSCCGRHEMSGAKARELAHDYCHGSGLDPEAVLAGWLELYAGKPALYEARGCAECRSDGYRGRVGVFELLVVTPALRQMMLARASAADLQQAAIAAGMRTMKQDGIAKCLAGLTDLPQVHAAAT